jgi:hypothetical protein
MLEEKGKLTDFNIKFINYKNGKFRRAQDGILCKNLFIKEGDIYCIKELCKISLHTVLFNRWLGEMNFKDTESSIPNIYYVKY